MVAPFAPGRANVRTMSRTQLLAAGDDAPALG